MININKLNGKIAEAGLSKKEFAEKLKINENTLTNKFKGRSSFKLDEVSKMCEILKITNKKDIVDIFFN